ncbi:MAG: hypothetical protein ABIR26_15940 [Ramlibacter sp.]
MNQTLSIFLGVLLGVAGCTPVSAQTPVYQCGSGKAVTYSEKPCTGGRLVNTDDAPVPVKPNPKGEDMRRKEENRVMAQTMRKRAGESTGQFETRRRRARLMDGDRAECARLDKRMPVEEASLTNPDKGEAAKAEVSLEASRKRFTQLGC